MGREKRIAESRTKEILERKTPESNRAEAVSAAPAAAAAPATVTSTGKALWHILLLFLVPAILLVVVGKLLIRP
jgi:hypothetical protein